MQAVTLTQSKWKSLFLAARPKTLTAALTPIFVASTLAYSNLKLHYSSHFYFKFCIYALLSTLFIQIGTNFINDALDYKKGADNLSRIGPKRATQNKWFTYKKMLNLGFFSFLLSAIFAIPLVLHSGVFILALGLVSLLCGYIYTGGPYPLAYKGLGELFVILFFGFGAICGLHFILTNSIQFNVFIASLQIGLLATTLISINNFRDYENDKLVNKLTLAARFGKTFARYEILSLFLGAYLLNIYWISKGQYISGLLPLISLPLAINCIKGLFQNEPSSKFNQYLGKASLIELLFGLGLGIGFLMA